MSVSEFSPNEFPVQSIGLKKMWDTLKSQQPHLRIRSAAEQLNVSELELLMTQPSQQRIRLNSQVEEILRTVEALGTVMALSRNDQVVHERTGIYHQLKVFSNGAMGLYLGDIDLRLFLKHWAYVFAVTEPINESTRRSLQFFDRSGMAIHKIYATEATDVKKWQEMVVQFTMQEPIPRIDLEAIVAKIYPNIGLVTSEEVRNPWSQLKDVHEFNNLLETLGVDRLEALENVGVDYASSIPLDSVEKALQQAASLQLEIMVFVGNRGIVQIFSGTVANLVRTGPWFNVMDPKFNLHLNTEELFSCWAVRRPSTDGIITSIDCFNSKRELVLSLFGARKPGQPELPKWQALVAELEPLK